MKSSAVLLLLVILQLAAPAHSMELASRLKRYIKTSLQKAPPKYLCFEAGDGEEIGIKLLGPTNALVGKVKEYTGSNACYDFYIVTRGKTQAQVRVYNESIACNYPVNKAKGPDGEVTEAPIRTFPVVFQDMNGHLSREFAYSSQAYLNERNEIEIVSFNQAFLISSKFAGSHASDRKNKYLGKIGFSCGNYALINNSLHRIDRLRSLHNR